MVASGAVLETVDIEVSLDKCDTGKAYRNERILAVIR